MPDRLPTLRARRAVGALSRCAMAREGEIMSDGPSACLPRWELRVLARRHGIAPVDARYGPLPAQILAGLRQAQRLGARLARTR